VVLSSSRRVEFVVEKSTTPSPSVIVRRHPKYNFDIHPEIRIREGPIQDTNHLQLHHGGLYAVAVYRRTLLKQVDRRLVVIEVYQMLSNHVEIHNAA
jgi:hypothetical protein